MTQINSTAVAFQWLPVTGAYLYTIYYSSYFCSESIVFNNDTNYHLIQDEDINAVIWYALTISVIFQVRGSLFEGQRSPPTVQGNN